MHRPRIALLVVLSALVAATGCSSVGDSAAAKVGSVEISRASLEDDLRAIQGADAYRAALEKSYGVPLAGASQGTFNTAFAAQVLTLRVYYELIDQALIKAHQPVAAADLSAAEASVKGQFAGVTGGPAILDGFPKVYRDRLVRQQAVVAASRRMVTGGGDAQAYFNANPTKFAPRTCVSHILVATSSRDDATARARALELKARLDKGEAFDAVAAASDDSAPKGDLGCHIPGNYVAEFETAMNAATIGKVTDPVKSQYGYHLILVRERTTPTFAEVREEVQAVVDQQSSTVLDAFLVKLTCDHKSGVSVDSRYGRWDLADCGGATNGLGKVTAPSSGATTSTTVAPTTTTTVK